MINDFKKLKAAVSDTDILIHLVKADVIDFLKLIFETIFIPQYVYDVEIKKTSGQYYHKIIEIINSSYFVFLIRWKN